MSEKKPRRADYEVGYGKPPKDTQIKPGERKNPGGRPRGSKNKLTLIKQALETKTRVRMGDKVAQKSLLEVALMHLHNGTLKGSAKDIAHVLRLALLVDAAEAKAPATPASPEPDRELTEEEEAMVTDLLDYRRRLRDAF